MGPDFPELRSARLVLRRFHTADAAALHAYRSHPDVARFQSWDEDYSLEDAKSLSEDMAAASFGAAGSWFQVAIADRESDVIIGDIGIHFHEDHLDEVELGYTLAHERQGYGLARDALSKLIEFLEKECDIRRCRAITDVRNLPSRRLLSRLGFKEVRVLEQNGFYKGEWCDEVECLRTRA